MELDLRQCLPELRVHGLLPSSHVAVYAGGSLVRGWGNASSDLDIYVITRSPWPGEGAQHDMVALDPATIAVEAVYVDRRRWDIEYWLESQADQLLAKVSSARLEGSEPAGVYMSSTEISFLQKLQWSAPIDNDEWWRSRRSELEGSALRSVMTLRALHYLDIYTEDAVGQLEAGDVESAVLSARLAWHYGVDALLASYGEFGESPKWVARRFRAVKPRELSFEQYWAIETMRSFDPEAPHRWIEEVLRACQMVSTEVIL